MSFTFADVRDARDLKGDLVGFVAEVEPRLVAALGIEVHKR